MLALGVTAFLAMGVVIGNYANTPEAVAAIANCVMVPMAFLSGSFFPIDTMPEWLQTFSRILPLRYLSDGLAGAITGTADADGHPDRLRRTRRLRRGLRRCWD